MADRKKYAQLEHWISNNLKRSEQSTNADHKLLEIVLTMIVIWPVSKTDFR